MALFLLDANGTPRAVGYRFETPETAGPHHYYHAQLIRSFGKAGVDWGIPCPVWLPDTQPAFVLDADDPIELLVCLLVSLYGRGYVDKELRGAEFWNQIEADIAKMRWQSLGLTYWRVHGQRNSMFYVTAAQRLAFVAMAASAHRGWSVVLSSVEECCAQEDAVRRSG